MGYYVTLTGADFVIPETVEVLAALHEMETKFHHLKRGGVVGGDEAEDRWFAWMPDVRTLSSVKEVFERLGFTVEETDEGVSLVGYDDKTGQEDLFLAVVAPFVKDESYLEWRGEDGELWKQTVREGTIRISQAEMTWGEESPYQYMHFFSYRQDGVFHTRGVHINLDEDVQEQINRAMS